MNLANLPCPIRNMVPYVLDAAESITGSSNLDFFETSVDRKAVGLRIATPVVILSYLSPYPFATFTLSSLGMLFAFRYDFVPAKKIRAENKIAEIIAESSDKPKKALIIQSPKDRYGAFSMRSHIQKVQELAKTHAISRVIVDDEEKFLKSLPPGRYDTVWLRAHGTPS